jgi:hypothetical protein
MKITCLSIISLIALAGSAHASVILDVTLTGTDLLDSFGGSISATPYSLAFQLADGNATGDGNNSAVLSNFQFGTGGPTGSPLLIGGAVGDLSSTVTLTDSGLANIFIQPYIAGATLQFRLTLTTNVDGGGTPDEFIFSILDNTLTPIPSASASPLGPFLVVDLDSANPSVTTFGGDPTSLYGFIAAPQVTVGSPVSSVPEPTSAALCVIPLICLAWILKRRTAGVRMRRLLQPRQHGA